MIYLLTYFYLQCFLYILLLLVIVRVQTEYKLFSFFFILEGTTDECQLLLTNNFCLGSDFALVLISWLLAARTDVFAHGINHRFSPHGSLIQHRSIYFKFVSVIIESAPNLSTFGIGAA